MAKNRKKQFEDEARLVSMSAESAKKLASNFKASSTALKDLIKGLNEVKDEIEDIGEDEKLLENLKEGGGLIRGLQEGLGEMAKSIDKSGTLSNIIKLNFKEVFKFANLSAAGSAAFANTLIRGVIELDALQTQLATTFGLSDKQATQVRDRIFEVSKASGNTLLNFKDVAKVIQGIGDETGILASTLRKDVLEESAELQKTLGLSNEQMATLALNAQKTGQNMEQQSLEMIRGVMAAEDMLGVNLDVNKAFKEAANVSGLIRANLGRSFEEITRVVAKAQAFGLTLNDLAGISSNLLDFQSSIEAELTAELFIGKQLNLEKARLFALTGDYENLQKEIVGQLGSEYEFLKLNVLAKQKYAAALGMSADQLSNMIFQEENLDALRAQAEARGDKQILAQIKQQTLAQDFSNIMAKVQESFINIAKGPMGDFANMLSNVLTDARAMKGIFMVIAGLKLAGLVNSISMLIVRMRILKVSTMITRGLMMGIGGLVLMGGIMAGLSALASSKANEEDTMVKTVPRLNTLGDGEIGVIERGMAVGDQGESIVNTQGLANMFERQNGILNLLIDETKNNKPSKPLAKHEITGVFR